VVKGLLRLLLGGLGEREAAAAAAGSKNAEMKRIFFPSSSCKESQFHLLPDQYRLFRRRPPHLLSLSPLVKAGRR